MKTILLAARKWWEGEEIWVHITSFNPVCFSPWWVMARTKAIVHPDCVTEFYTNFWNSRLK